MKVAKLVSVSMTTRVIVEEGASENEILMLAQMKFIEKIENEIHEHNEGIEDDEECPYDPSFDEEDIEDRQPRLTIGNDTFDTKTGKKINFEE